MTNCSLSIIYCVEKARGIIGADPSWEKSKRFESFDDARDEYFRITLKEIAKESESIEWIREYAEDEVPYKEFTAVVTAGGHYIDVSLAMDDGTHITMPPENESGAYLCIIGGLVRMIG